MARRKLVIPVSLVLFLVGTFVGLYFVRGYILRQHLFRAIDLGDEKSIRDLVTSWPSPVNAVSPEGLMLLHWAANRGDDEMVRFLIDHGADVRAKAGAYSWMEAPAPQATPLHWAADGGHVDVARQLVAAGADVNAMAHAEAPWCSPPLTWATQAGRTAMVRFLLESGAEINATNERGETALHVAAYRGHTETVRVLLQHGAMVNIRDNRGNTPLHAAAGAGWTSTARALREHGATE